MGNKVSLSSIDPDKVSNLPRKGELIKCIVSNVHDGDTITIVYMVGKNVPFKVKLRMDGIDAPEISSKNPIECSAGEAVTEWLRAKIKRQKYWWAVLKKWDKYGGRVVGTLYQDSHQSTMSINEEMLDKGLVVSYAGGKKEEWTTKMLEEIIEAIEIFEGS